MLCFICRSGICHAAQWGENTYEIKYQLNGGINGKDFTDISSTIIHHDPFMVLADFADYQRAQKKVQETFRDKKKWNQMSLMNIALSGRFAADRAINEYAENIWNTQKMF